MFKSFIALFNLSLLICFLVLIPNLTFAKYDPSLDWHTIETEYFLFHYHDGLENVVHEFAQHGEKIHHEITEYFQWSPKEKTHVVLSDHQDFPNGRAGPLPNNVIELFMTPPSEVKSLEDYLDWKYLVFEHEYVHTIQLDMASEFPLHMRSFLGRHWLFFPNTFLPNWIIEGIATHIETDKQQGIGRGQSSYFRALMRNEVKYGPRTLGQTNQAQLDWPGGTNRYLYGVYFFNFLEERYGTRSIQAFMQAYSKFPIPFFINTTFNKIYKKSLFQLWSEFENYLQDEFNTELSQNVNLKNQGNQISYSGFHSGFSKLLPDGSVLFIRENRKDIKALVKYFPNKNTFQTLYESAGISSTFDVNENQGILISLFDWINHTRLVSDLYLINLETAKLTRLTKDKRYINAIWHSDGKHIIAVQNKAGQHALHLLDNSGQLIKILWEKQHDVVIGSFDISPNGEKLIASIFRPNKGWNLEEFLFAQQQWKAITQNSYIEAQPVYSSDGENILYSAEYTGIYNIYQLSLSDKKLQQITKVDSAAYYPTHDEQENILYYSGLTNNGFNLISQKYLATEVLENDLIQKPSKVNEKKNEINDSVKYQVSSYNGLRYLQMPWWHPLVIFTDDQFSLGFVTSTRDPLEKHLYSLAFAFDIQNFSPQWNFNYLYSGLRPNIILSTIQNNFYPNADQFRQERGASLNISFPFRYVNRQWSLFSSIKRISSQFYLQSNRDDVLKTIHDDLLAFGLNFNNTSQPSLAVSNHSGGTMSITYELDQFAESIKSSSRIVFNASLSSPRVFDSVIKISNTMVMSGNDSGLLRLGGYTNELFSSSFAGKRSYNLRGYSDDRFTGTNLHKFDINLHVPLIYPQSSIMSPPFGVSKIKFQPFFETARVGQFRQISKESWRSSLGAEIVIQTNFGYGRFPFNVKMGIAQGLNAGGEQQFYICLIPLVN